MGAEGAFLGASNLSIVGIPLLNLGVHSQLFSFRMNLNLEAEKNRERLGSIRQNPQRTGPVAFILGSRLRLPV